MAEPSSGARQNAATAETVLRHKITKDYVVLSNAVARDHRLSYRARGVLLEMVSRPRNWRFSAERLALASPSEGRDAIRTALRELELLGYVSRKRERLPNGRVRTVVTVSDQPVPEWRESATRFMAVTLPDAPPWESGAFPQVIPKTVQPTSGDPSSIEVQGQEVHSDRTCVRSLASLAPGDPPENAAFDPDMRELDRQLWRDLIDGDIETDRSKWKTTDPNQRVFTADAFYDAYRKRPGNRVRFPGRWLEAILDNGTFEDWLIDEGLTIIERR